MVEGTSSNSQVEHRLPCFHSEAQGEDLRTVRWKIMDVSQKRVYSLTFVLASSIMSIRRFRQAKWMRAVSELPSDAKLSGIFGSGTS